MKIWIFSCLELATFGYLLFLFIQYFPHFLTNRLWLLISAEPLKGTVHRHGQCSPVRDPQAAPIPHLPILSYSI